MHYITPDLINQINNETGDDIDNLWNEKIDSFMQHCQRIKDYLPFNARKFMENNDFINFTAFCRSGNFGRDEYAFVLGDTSAEDIYMLSYKMPEDLYPLIETFEGRGFSQNEVAIWLYDEFHYKKSYYEHHIIFSDGMSYIIPFLSFSCRKTSWFSEFGD